MKCTQNEQYTMIEQNGKNGMKCAQDEQYTMIKQKMERME